jgi:hypothetical protein
MNIFESTTKRFGYSDALSKASIWERYANYFAGEEIMEEGFNINTGYVYLALENGVTIASCFGQAAEFFVYDEETEEEISFLFYQDLQDYLNK